MNSYKLKLNFWAEIYFLVLLACYSLYIVGIFEYEGYQNNFTYNKMILAIVSTYILSNLVSTEKSLTFFHTLLLVLFFIPCMVFFTVTGDYYFYSIVTLACLIVILTSRFVPLKPFRIAHLKTKQLLSLLTAISIIYLLALVAFGGLRYFNLNIWTVYEHRADAANLLPGIFGYISSPVGKVLVPLIITIAVINKRWGYFISGIVISILIFGFTQHKMPLFTPIFIAAIYFLMSKEKYETRLYQGVIIVIATASLGFYLFQNYAVEIGLIPGTLFVRRLLMLPPLLTHFYLEFFSSNPVYIWSTSKVTLGLISNPYDTTAPFMIGEYYFGRKETSANVGWVGSGFANLRLTGVIVYSIGLGLLVSLLASYSRLLGNKFVAATSSILLLSLYNSTDLLTGIITHGFLFLIIIYMLYSKYSGQDTL